MSSSVRRTRSVVLTVSKLFKCRSACIIGTQHNRYYSQSVAAELSETPEKWDLVGAMYLERLPVITPPLRKIEKRYKEYRHQIEVENSLLSDYEIAKIQEEDRLALQTKNVLDTPLHLRNVPVQTMQDREEIWNKELAEFSPAPRVTEADESGDMKSLDRKLDQTLVLLVKQKIDGKEYWYLPMLQYIAGTSMRQVAEQAVANTCGADLKIQTFGNAPSGYQLKMYNKELQEDTKAKGRKIFIYKAEYRSGLVTPSKDSVLDYVWVAPSELRQYVGRTTSRIFNKFNIY
ncbi:39S ribosomal protein L46, mitochondrial-like [Ostrea edulis]|uniref:39S ribosomal protein L46, mitochondrial-like n=1 Tax=Ostrea edulis TaxID=37623 RepID=UPI0024AF3E39|nr:39S ribosomal protein L46, mitochondrial-like [Ostrea edulis]